MSRASVQNVHKGDIIIERTNGKKRMTPVRTVEFNACSSHGVHVNKNACYEYNAVVELVEGDGTLGDLEKDLLKSPEEMTDEELEEELRRSISTMEDDLLYESMSQLY